MTPYSLEKQMEDQQKISDQVWQIVLISGEDSPTSLALGLQAARSFWTAHIHPNQTCIWMDDTEEDEEDLSRICKGESGLLFQYLRFVPSFSEVFDLNYLYKGNLEQRARKANENYQRLWQPREADLASMAQNWPHLSVMERESNRNLVLHQERKEILAKYLLEDYGDQAFIGMYEGNHP